ncbi:MAG: alkaline phosphatase family protein [Anaerolineae bacterium]|nr:alkaline phosphatase family protein [Anaerolineae bacterium]
MDAATFSHRIRHVFFAACIIYWSMIFAPSPQLAATAQQNFVLHINVSGLRSRDLHAMVNMGKLPNFAQLHAQGAWTHNARIDADNALWRPNQVSLLTGRPMLNRFGIPNSGHGWMSDSPPDLNATLHRHVGYYVASTFDMAHDQGLRTSLYATDHFYALFKNSFNAANGALDAIEHDDGFDKIDVYVNAHHDTSYMMSALLNDLAVAPSNYTFVQFHDLASAGYQYGWGSPAYHNNLVNLDQWLGEIFNAVRSNAVLSGTTSIVLTSDRAGSEVGIEAIDGVDPSDAANYTVPFFVWGPGIPQNADLYVLNGWATGNPGTHYVDYQAATQPIRNSSSANCALQRLGLPSIPYSSFDQLNGACGKAPVLHKPPTPQAVVARAALPTSTPIYVLVTMTPMPRPTETPLPIAQATPAPTAGPTTAPANPEPVLAIVSPPKAAVANTAPIQTSSVAASKPVVAVLPRPTLRPAPAVAAKLPAQNAKTLVPAKAAPVKATPKPR